MSKILVVEDEPDILDQVRKSLTREQYLVDTAADGAAAMDLLSVSSYDLVILDWMLPKQSGIDICKWYRGRGGKTPILMLTARGDYADKELGLDTGADDYLTKPFHLREFLARVRALLRRNATAAPTNVLTSGNLSLDRAARRVTRDGSEIKLEPKEFNLLEFLMRHPGQAFTAEALVQRVWESDTLVSPDAVRVYIRYLRKKLDLDGEESIISTVKGSGYRFDQR